MANDKIVLIPTYNESDTIADLVSRILELCPDTDILIIDDNSPDGTGRIADELASGDSRIICLHRPRKEGLGPAYVEGFKKALEGRYRYIAHMDADFSHDPKHLPEFFEAIKDCDLVIGSRYAPGGGTRNWGIVRRILSRFGSLYARTILGLRINDMTGGFKCYRREVMESIGIETLTSKGYAFLIEMTYRTYRKGFRIKEIFIRPSSVKKSRFSYLNIPRMFSSIIFMAVMLKFFPDRRNS